MLRELHIENVAVIERTDLELGPGLNILTGETGAGKSILVDAMHAILGSRASRELVRTGAEKAVVCATFDPEPCRAWCDENEIECDDELIIRRQITAEGKTSCRVCGVPVTTAQLRDLGALLLDIHGQNDGRHLLDEREHLRSLDKFGRLEPELARYQAQYQAYQALCKERDTLSAYENEKELLTDSLSRQLEELEHAQLKAGEEAELAERSDLLRRALAGLSEEDRELFLRRYYYNQTAEQIAQEKHMNANTVRSRLARGRQALKAELQKGAIQIEDLCAESV